MIKASAVAQEHIDDHHEAGLKTSPGSSDLSGYTPPLKTGIGIRVTRLDGQLLWVNPEYCRILGYSGKTLRGTPLFSLVFSGDVDTIKAAMLLVRAGKKPAPYEYRVITRRKRVRWLCEKLTLAHNNGEATLIGTSIDVTDR